jgi:NADH-quinone oxidoreductase subunit A
MGEAGSAYAAVGLFVVGGAVFVLLLGLVSRLLAPWRPNPEKNSTYECGEEPTGSALPRFHPRYYIVALVFLLFEVEILFLFPWITVYARPELLKSLPGWGLAALAEMGVFVLLLLLGLAYVWRTGGLEWVRPQPPRPQSPAAIPEHLYEQVNRRYGPAAHE